MPVNLHLAFGLYAVNGLIVDYTPVVLEKHAIFTSDINQHSRKTILSRAVGGISFGIDAVGSPHARFGSACISVATTARIARIHWTKTAAVAVTACSGIVVQRIATVKTPLIRAGNPIGRAVVCLGRIHKNGCCSRRKSETVRHHHIIHVDAFLCARLEHSREKDYATT